MLFIDTQQEKGEHDQHHAHRRRAAPQRPFQQKEKRDTKDCAAAETDQLPFCQIERHFGFYFCQVLGDWHISHFFTSNINKKFFENFLLNSSIAKWDG